MGCPNCGSESVIKKGKQRGRQRYQCTECGRKWQECPEKKDIPDILQQIQDRFSPEELRALARGNGINPNQQQQSIVSFEGEEVKIGFCTDTHIGSRFFNDSLWYSFLDECRRQDVSRIFHTGDIIEGMSNRPDQIYSLDDVGFSAQMDHAERLLAMSEIPIDAIDGNHDRWGIKSGGILAVKDLANRLPNMTFLGHDCADVFINGSKWRLFHGEDGASYATSYRIQKLIESFTGGDKPQVLLCGHTHKQGYFFDRNIHAVSGGALSYQSDWMRSKRLANHTGFHIIKATIREKEVASFTVTWFPFYN